MNYQEISSMAVGGSEWAQKLKAEHDKVNAELLAERQARLDARPGMRVGDIVITETGVRMRVAHHWGDSIQLAEGGSYYLSIGGHVSMSGGLEQGIPAERFVETDERREGSVWFFSQDSARAHNGWETQAVFKVFRLVGGDEFEKCVCGHYKRLHQSSGCIGCQVYGRKDWRLPKCEVFTYPHKCPSCGEANCTNPRHDNEPSDVQ